MENNILNSFLNSSTYWGAFLTLTTYEFGAWLHKKTKIFLFSPLIVSVTICILFLAATKIPYAEYEKSSKIIAYMLTPATVCLAIPLYQQFQKLKENAFAVLAGIVFGVLINLFSVWILCMLFKIGHTEYVSLLPKSITTAISFALTQQYGGHISITAMMVIIAGNIGNLFAEQICRLCRITEPVAKGVAIGTASHALGTSKAIEIGEVEGAMSGLSIAVTGLITVLLMPLFANLI